MSRKKCCVSGCMESENFCLPLHIFPNPTKEPKRFNEWVYRIGSDILGLNNKSIFDNRKICHAHFEKKYCCGSNRLSNIAIPTLNMPGSMALPKFTLEAQSKPQKHNPTTEPTPLADSWMLKTTDGGKHADHNYTGTASEDPLREKSACGNKSNDGKNIMMNLEDILRKTSASYTNSIHIEDPLPSESISKNDTSRIDLEVISDPLMGRLTSDTLEDNPMIYSEDALRERLRTYSKSRKTTQGLKDPLNLNITDVDKTHNDNVMELEDHLIEEWIDDTEINDHSMCDSEDPLKERLNNDSQLYGGDDNMADSDDTMSESDDGLLTAKYKLLELFASLDDSELDSIEQWICSKAYKKDLDQKISLLKKENMLVKISNTLKKVLPFEAELPTEKIIPPTVGSQADCNEYNTCHIDEFLYDEDDVEKLVETGKVKRHYCLDCYSRNTKALTYISHSMSRQAVQYIFTVLLPKDLEDKQVLDVGSRIGAVLYGAYYFSNAGTIIGIEMNKECYDIQERIVLEYSMDNNRIKIVHSDVMDRSDIVSNSDIIVINNPDFFIDIETHKKMWYFFKKHVKKGSYLVSSRSVTDTLDSLGILDELINWLSICKPHQQDNEVLFDIEDYNEIFLYAVN